jgi:3-phenylpropionate/trans-cinnamate dioxygenase ferredoxin component
MDASIEFYPVVSSDELAPGERLVVDIDQVAVVIFNIDGTFYAVDDLCTHDDGSLNEGQLEGCLIVCPRHGAKFDVRTGKAVALPAYQDINSYPVRVVDGQIEIGIPA